MRALSKLGAFVRRHKVTEEALGEAIAIDLARSIVKYVVGGAAVASAATLTTLALQPGPTHHPNLSLSVKGAAFVTRNEGVRYAPYNDPLNCTVGVGHLIHYGKCSNYDLTHWKISPAQSAVLLMHDSAGASSCVNGLTHALTQGQFDALVDLTFNAGCGALDYSGLRGLVDGGKLGAVPPVLRRTAVTASGIFLRGLATRRALEATLFSSGYYGAGIGYALPPKPPTAADLLRAKTGYYAWLAWYLGEKPWKKYGPHATKVRPHVPARIPAVWWRREHAFVKARA